ncbi:MAG: hypothetical protein ACD_36C00073G0004 [uncultured bacterium]|uniref:Transposase IS200-like domain-containing protein n=1 Tax=Candidatus Gottesmanbacteria bacterium RIFCSPLOWO2_01_FULL_43_11b TaxID=1798392 RepID=A0A1F6AGW8_9BACT|nr:MAG: hypothetical protein ACD_36C00073G0004 [uncultured bacterium]OGG23653.1 MAG: hypothetical protein A3A79_00395 [Candidatus Gottesmanbacteria bacterium RIFCSPLOWO2_01_FULL_43_11b]
MPHFRPEYFEHGVYHIYNRGVAKLPTFLDSEDYHSFEDILRYLVAGFPEKKDANLPVPVTYKADPKSNGLFKSLLSVLAYCLMPNHFHLLIQQKAETNPVSFQPIPELVRRLCITYSHKFNKKYNREGAIFQGRFKIKNIPSDPDLLQVVRYIHLNPVVAGLVQKPEHWLFSDYRVYAIGSMRTFQQVTSTDLVLSYFKGLPNRYKEFVDAVISEQEAKVIENYIIDRGEE